MYRMLLGETQNDFASLIRSAFARDCFNVHVEDNGWRIMERLRQHQYDIIVLQIALAGFDGIRVVRDYRNTGGSTPVILMAGKHCSQEMEHALDAGGDAYLVKPLSISDLAAQVRALLRRPAIHRDNVLRWGEVSLDIEAGTVTREDRLIHLYPMEFKLLHFLLSHPDQVFDAETLVQRVWHKDFGRETVKTHIKALRRKVDLEGHPSIVTTVRGFGYKSEKLAADLRARLDTPQLVAQVS